MPKVRSEPVVTRVLRPIALSAFTGYCVWNVFWLAQGRLAPSLWTTVTGLPCPSTGMTRSMQSLLAGRWSDCVLYNPLTGVFVLLMAYSAYRLGFSWRSERRLRMPSFVGWLWLLAIGAAWLSKFVIGPAYW